MTDAPRTTLSILIDEEERARSLADDALTGLCSRPKVLPPRWFYDERGSELYEAITEIEEYYPARREREILEAHAQDIAETAGAESLVEIGSGSAAKTRILLDALTLEATFQRYVPFDVCEEFVKASGEEIAASYPGIEVNGVVGDFSRHLGGIEHKGRELVIFLGGTIGNLLPEERSLFLSNLRASMTSGDTLLLGADLVKDADRMVAAYDDSAGVTAEFNRNVLRVLNRELGADFSPPSFEHVALWREDMEWIEMRLRSRVAQKVRVDGLGLEFVFDEGEEMRTEVSTKFRQPVLEMELHKAGFELEQWWTDEGGDFSLSLSKAA